MDDKAEVLGVGGEGNIVVDPIAVFAGDLDGAAAELTLLGSGVGKGVQRPARVVSVRTIVV